MTPPIRMVSVPVEPSEEMIRASLAVEFPATYRDHLRHPDDGPKWREVTEQRIERERKRWSAMLTAAPVREEGGADHHERNLSMTNDQLIERALSHPPLEAPAEAGEDEWTPLERLADAATHGPWKACGTIYEHMNCEVRGGAKGEGQAIAQVWDGPNAFKDGQFIAAADPSTIKRLIAALRAQPQAREEVQPGCARCNRGEVFGLSMDDGFWVEFSSAAGGAHPAGMHGWLELAEHHPDGRIVIREYVAKDSPIYPAPEAEKLRLAVEAFLPSAEVAFLWTKETPPAYEVQRYRERYWAVKEALAALQQEGRA